mmetsp:Transcript_61265/g.200309  ORF Transcript_61265/g.200309 Transcript_61265/m.200309 type:complete len:217 (+) Transcript_61265:508-1158(+)
MPRSVGRCLACAGRREGRVVGNRRPWPLPGARRSAAGRPRRSAGAAADGRGAGLRRRGERLVALDVRHQQQRLGVGHAVGRARGIRELRRAPARVDAVVGRAVDVGRGVCRVASRLRHGSALHDDGTACKSVALRQGARALEADFGRPCVAGAVVVVVVVDVVDVGLLRGLLVSALGRKLARQLALCCPGPLPPGSEHLRLLSRDEFLFELPLLLA